MHTSPVDARASKPAVKRRARARRSLYKLVKKVHMYRGLLNFSNLLVFGVAGLTATLSVAPGNEDRRSRGCATRASFPAPARATSRSRTRLALSLGFSLSPIFLIHVA